MDKLARIPTPGHVRWERVQHRLIPFLAVLLCTLVAWRLWHDGPGSNAVGQVEGDTVEVRAPAAGRLVDLPGGKPAELLDTVVAGQVVARVMLNDSKFSDVPAPIAGQIVKILREPGHSVDSGQAIITLSSDRGRSVTTYLRADQSVRPEPGMAVDVREQSPSRTKAWKAVVARVGVRYEQIPASQMRDKKTEQWGRPVVLSLPPDADLKPGEMVYVGWRAGM